MWKLPVEHSSYRPINLFQTLVLKRIQPILATDKIIPDHKFGFTNKHATIKPIHRVVKITKETVERKQYFFAAFLDVTHASSLYKLKPFFSMAIGKKLR